VFDADGNLVSYDYARPNAILKDVKRLIKKHGWEISDAFSVCTSNPGRRLSELFSNCQEISCNSTKGKLKKGGMRTC
jgi:hypothetical protein